MAGLNPSRYDMPPQDIDLLAKTANAFFQSLLGCIVFLCTFKLTKDLRCKKSSFIRKIVATAVELRFQVILYIDLGLLSSSHVAQFI